MTQDLTTRYSRQMMLPGFGEQAQRRLQAASVLIVGLGGLGSAVAIYLAGAGAGHIGLADPDTVSLSNLQRQVLYTTAETGQPKTACAARRLTALNPGIRLSVYPEGLTPDNATELIRQYDLVVDCTDNFPTRYLIDDTCHATGIPWVHGAIGEWHGQVTVFGHTSRRRYTDLYPDRDTLCRLPRRTMGVTGPLPGVIGSLQASEVIKLITGTGTPLDGRILTIDINTMHTELFDF